MKSLATLAAAATMLATLSVSAGAQPPPGAAPPPNRHPACFWIPNITNFAANDTQTLYLRVGGNQVWALSLFSDCFQLDWVHRVGIRNRGAGRNICEGPNPGIDVLVRDEGIGRRSCPVTAVRKLTPDEVAALPPLARP